jgi:NAD(P)-dependent dehydrogenase (short-subunit alcohol dehydrogenase family)
MVSLTSSRRDVAVVTGGNRGIGLGLATGMAKAGRDVCIWGRDAEAGKAALPELRSYGTRVEWQSCDITEEAQVVAAFGHTVERFGRVDACFANAGATIALLPFVDLELDLWRRTTALNLDGTMLVLREAARHMIARGQGGSLVVTSSIAGIHGAARNEAYATCKAGLIGLSRSLAVELARYRIRCNALVAGWTDTDMNEMVKANTRWNEAIMSRVPVGRWGTIDDFHALAAYLGAREPLYHTGDEIVIDGGYTKF